MFKVGDKVVYRKQCSIIWDGVYTVDALLTNGDVIERDCQTPKEFLSHATPEEIAAGHRIDHFVDINNMVNCEILDYPEDYTSPNCKKFDERVK